MCVFFFLLILWLFWLRFSLGFSIFQSPSMEGCDFFGIPVQKVDRANYLGDILQSGGKKIILLAKNPRAKNVLFASLFFAKKYFSARPKIAEKSVQIIHSFFFNVPNYVCMYIDSSQFHSNTRTIISCLESNSKTFLAYDIF